ncbi:MAG: UDP-N-acetylmuramoyl-tripeptide--D-alanyl-D-alanine ligase [Bacteroidota bacterium]
METAALYQLFKKQKQVSTDTRKITKDSIFFALKGPRFNGNNYALEALEKGASFAVIDELSPEHKDHPQLILVENVLESLQKIANIHRKTLGIPVIAITGSNGKTTTKELVYQVLSQKFKTYATPGNFNNHIGLPLTILRTPPETEMLILEMGDNNLGEIAVLCEIANPDYGLITNIGKDHLEGFGSFENNLRAKSELFQYLIQNSGNAFIPTKDPILKNMAKRFKNPILFGDTGNQSFLQLNEQTVFVSFRTEEGKVHQTQLFGKYNFANVEAAYSIGKYFKIPYEELVKAICDYIPQNNRSQIIEKAKNTLLLDAYNANPSSVSAVLESFISMQSEKPKIVILGDMLELGKTSKQEHFDIAEKGTQANLICIFCGALFYEVRESFKKGLFFKDKEQLIQYLLKTPIMNHMVLLKGSRGLKLETLIEYL